VWILGVDTSTRFLNLSIVDDERTVAEFSINDPRGHSSNLIPLIAQLCKNCRLDFSQLNGFSLNIGPGSFTGLRIGLATIKGFAVSLKKPVVGVPGLDILARNIAAAGCKICPLIDAKREQVYAAVYEFKDGQYKRLTPYLLTPVAKLLKQTKGKTVFLGDGLEKFALVIRKQKKSSAVFAPPIFWYPRASAVARLGLELIKKGKADNPDKLVPLYLYPRECSVRKI